MENLYGGTIEKKDLFGSPRFTEIEIKLPSVET
jgi:hypothetical protein